MAKLVLKQSVKAYGPLVFPVEEEEEEQQQHNSSSTDSVVKQT